MSQFSGPTWKSSHVYGDSFFNHKHKLFYVNIPKCASSWMKEYVDLMGSSSDVNNFWLQSNFTTEYINDYQPVIILRDPVARWLSICPCLNYMNEENFIQQLPNMFSHTSAWWLDDEHTAPQTDFIQGLDLSNAIFFYCDNNLSTNVQHFLKSRQIVINPPAPTNIQPINEQYVRGTTVWKSLFADELFFSRFKQVYKNDYDLINTVKIYGK